KNSWALKAISALEENGVTIGTGGNMYSPYTHVTREQYSQFLYNSINAVEKETKPEVKPDPKPEEKPEVKPDPKPEEKPEVKPDPKPEEKPEVKPDPKPEEKPEVKPDPKPEEKPEVKPDPKPEEKPEVKPDPKPEEKPEVKPDPKPEEKPEVKPDPKPVVPEGLDTSLVAEDFSYYPESLNTPVVQKQLSQEAQSILKEINSKYNTNLQYKDPVHIVDKNMYLPEGSIGAQFSVAGSPDDFKILFLDNNKATVELAKKWTTLLNGLNLDKEIQETVDAKTINNYQKGNYKIRIGQSMTEHTMYIDVQPK
ncbi:S-layer homology domain-containing protein, partial [Bacillus cereus]|nr:S-layer homology domain-containing protein [Bacillus cereus]